MTRGLRSEKRFDSRSKNGARKHDVSPCTVAYTEREFKASRVNVGARSGGIFSALLARQGHFWQPPGRKCIVVTRANN